ncbi:GNAT family N-acetyltransferase [Yeosuana marina]|uniref:GNAT family N-acetyltransferase n=1 Tax=Yeosuana marina TaxID=1565536 RepID=UPI0030C895A3
MKNVIIRFVEISDLEDLVRLCEQHAHFERSDYNPKNKKQKLGEHLFSDTPSLYCLVVERLGQLIGFTTFMKQFSTWDSDFYLYMDCLFLTEESRGYGIGKQLLDKIKKEAIRNQCGQIQWQTPNFNKRAIKFYNRIGAISKKKERFFIRV